MLCCSQPRVWASDPPLCARSGRLAASVAVDPAQELPRCSDQEGHRHALLQPGTRQGVRSAPLCSIQPPCGHRDRGFSSGSTALQRPEGPLTSAAAARHAPGRQIRPSAFKLAAMGPAWPWIQRRSCRAAARRTTGKRSCSQTRASASDPGVCVRSGSLAASVAVDPAQELPRCSDQEGHRQAHLQRGTRQGRQIRTAALDPAALRPAWPWIRRRIRRAAAAARITDRRGCSQTSAMASDPDRCARPGCLAVSLNVD